MTTVSRPRVNGQIISAATLVGLTDQKVLLVGQQTAAGTATSGALRSNFLNDNAWDAEYGENSMLAGMVRGYRTINKETQVDAIGLDDASGTAATGTITFTGPATEAGTITVVVGSETNHSFDVPVASGDTATVIGDALEALITADSKIIVTAANVAGVVTLTAVHDGLEGNFISIKTTGTVAGVGYTVVAMASGATNPTLTGLFDVVDGIRYQTVVIPQSYGISTLTDFLDPRFNVNDEVLDGVGVISITDTFSNNLATVTAENSQSVVALTNKKVDNATYRGSSLLELDTVTATLFAAVRSLRLTDGAAVADILIADARGYKDAFGGIHMASLPYHNTEVAGLPIVQPEFGYTKLEIDQLVTAGGSVIGANRGKTEAILDKIVTTYKTDQASNPDVTFKTLNNVDELSAIREFYFNNVKKEYSQSRLSRGDLKPGYSNANVGSVSAFCVGLHGELADNVIVDSGADALKIFKDALVVEISDFAAGELTIAMLFSIMGQLRVVNFTVQPKL
jgi:phage tail sheath gpL-like